MLRKLMVAVVLMAVLAACRRADLMKALVPSADQQVAKGYIDLLRQHRFDQIEKDVAPGLRTAGLHDMLVKMAAALPPQNPVSVEVVGANTIRGSSVTRDDITFEYQFPDRWLLASVATQKAGGVSTITGIHVDVLPDSLEHLNRLSHMPNSRAT